MGTVWIHMQVQIPTQILLIVVEVMIMVAQDMALFTVGT